ncbi:MAG: hypothetical protein LLG14_14705 [Nocardiaceae bacterium]|nr:hypothetical protein [Nocardiaceae bacterium]
MRDGCVRAQHDRLHSPWEPYGGGSASDIFENFGMGERVFFARAVALLDSDYVASHFDSAAARRIQDVCLQRLML